MDTMERPEAVTITRGGASWSRTSDGGFADARLGPPTADFRRRRAPEAQRGATGSNAASVPTVSRAVGLQRVLQIVLLSSESATADVWRIRVATPDLAMAVLLRLHAPEAWR